MAAEAQKRQDEVRAMAREAQNKACFDCGKQGPQFNVVTDLLVFVCQDCSGLHRNYGHKSKSISMTTFTEKEVADLRNGGNKKASKKWHATLTKDKFSKDLKDEKNLREFMDLVYKSKAFYSEEPIAGDDAKGEKKEKKKKDVAAAAPAAAASSSASPFAIQSADDLLDDFSQPSRPATAAAAASSAAHNDDPFGASNDPFGDSAPPISSPAHRRRLSAKLDDFFVRRKSVDILVQEKVLVQDDLFGFASPATTNSNSSASAAAAGSGQGSAVTQAIAQQLHAAMAAHRLDFGALWTDHVLPALRQLPGFDARVLGAGGAGAGASAAAGSSGGLPPRHTRTASVNPFLAAAAPSSSDLTLNTSAAAAIGNNVDDFMGGGSGAVGGGSNPFSPVNAASSSSSSSSSLSSSIGGGGDDNPFGSSAPAVAAASGSAPSSRPQHRTFDSVDLLASSTSGFSAGASTADDLFGGVAIGAGAGSGNNMFGAASAAASPMDAFGTTGAAAAKPTLPSLPALSSLPAQPARADPLAALADMSTIAARRPGFADRLSLAGTNGGGNAGFPAGGNSYAAMMTAPVLSNSMNMNPNHIFGDVGAMGGGGSSSFGNSGPSSAGAMSSGMNFGMGMGGAIDSNHFRAMPMGSGSNGGFDSMGFPVQQQQQQQPFQQLQQQQQQPAPMSYAPQHNPQPLQNQQQNMMSMGAHGLGNGSGYAPNLSPSINPLPSTPQLNGNAAAVGMSQMSLAGAATMMPNQSNQPFGQMQQQHQHGQQQQQLQPQYQSQQQQQPYSGMMAAPQSNWGGGAAMSPSIGGYGMQQPNFPGGQQGPMPGGQFQGMSQMQQQQPYGVQQSMGGQMMPMGMQQHQPMQMQAMPQPQAPAAPAKPDPFAVFGSGL